MSRSVSMMKRLPKEFDASPPGIAARCLCISRVRASELGRIYPSFAASQTQCIAPPKICEYICKTASRLCLIYMGPARRGADRHLCDGHADTRRAFGAFTGRIRCTRPASVACRGHWRAGFRDLQMGRIRPRCGRRRNPFDRRAANDARLSRPGLFWTWIDRCWSQGHQILGGFAVTDPRTPPLYKYERFAKRGHYEITRYS